jgi:agmatinase
MSYSSFFSSVEPLVGLREERTPIVSVFGVPFDGTTTFRPGTRFGPNTLRHAFMNVEAYSRVLKVNVEKVKIRDMGNLTRLGDPKDVVKMVSLVAKELRSGNQRFCMLGGEHLITLGALEKAPKEDGYVVFDAHFDLRDEFEGLKYSHACYLRRILETRNPRTIAHIGGRAATEEEWKISRKLGFRIDSAEVGSPDALKKFVRFISSLKKVYVSIDLDVLDPAYAPGVGNPEPGGPSTETLLRYVYALQKTAMSAFDIVELCPPYDNGPTATAAARFMNELIAICTLQK